MWNDVCGVQGRDAIHGCSVVVLTAQEGFRAVTGKYDTVFIDAWPQMAVSIK